MWYHVESLFFLFAICYMYVVHHMLLVFVTCRVSILHISFRQDYSHLQKGDVFSLALSVYECAGGGPLPKNGDEWHRIRQGSLRPLRHLSHDLNELLKVRLTFVTIVNSYVSEQNNLSILNCMPLEICQIEGDRLQTNSGRICRCRPPLEVGTITVGVFTISPPPLGAITITVGVRPPPPLAVATTIVEVPSSVSVCYNYQRGLTQHHD